jgi:hypothetical protein
MRIHILALGLVSAASLYGQAHRTRWQDLCFKNPAAPFCQGNDYAIKPSAKKKSAAATPNVVTNPFPPTPQTVTPSVIVVGGIDWRFADPFADALVGFNFTGLSASPIARSLIAQLGANQGLSEADMRKIFDGLSGVDQVALSVHDNRIVAMVTGRVTDSALPTPEANSKAVLVSGNAMLIGHPDAVDQAVQRIAMKSPPAELTRLAEERQANSEFWAVGSDGLVGPQAVSAGVKRFSLTVSIRNRLTSDMAFEFDGVPSADTLRMWQTTLGAATIEGNAVHVRVSMEGDEVQPKFSQVVGSPLGQRLAALVEAARYLPVHDVTVPKHAKPMIYGLEGGPKEVN